MIYFKDWLQCDEGYSHDIVINGPFRFYHGTSSGKNDEIFNSFKRDGASPSGYGHGQGGGISFPQELSSEEMVNYLRKHHDPNLHTKYPEYIDYIKTFTKYVLKSVPLNDIKTDLPMLDKSKVEEYKKMDFSTSPPIVLADGYILDGYHRANVAKSLGLPTIQAYVGIKK